MDTESESIAGGAARVAKAHKEAQVLGNEPEAYKEEEEVEEGESRKEEGEERREDNERGGAS